MILRKIYFTLLAVALSATTIVADTIVHTDQAVPLVNLLGGDTLTVGTKTFSDFSYASVGDMPTAADVQVIPISSDGYLGIRLDADFIDLVGGAASDSLIGFTVETPEASIKSTILRSDASVSGNGISSITETFLPGIQDVQLTNTAGVNLEDATTFTTPVKKLNVQKDILLLADDEPATMSYVDQLFPLVPEPSGCATAIAGLLCMGLLRKRIR